MILTLLVLGAAVAIVVIVVGVFIANRVGAGSRGGSGTVPTYSTPHPLLYLPDSVRQDVQMLAQRGEKIAAIKLLRDHASIGLKEAKEYVERIAHMPVGAAPVPSNQMLSAANQEELRLLMRQGKKIQAIKQYREITGAGLKDAKDAVEAL